MSEDLSSTTHHMTKIIVAEAISRKHTVRVGIDSDGYTAQMQFSEAVRNWDVERISTAILRVAAVAHDRYVALNATAGTTYLTSEQIAANERELDF